MGDAMIDGVRSLMPFSDDVDTAWEVEDCARGGAEMDEELAVAAVLVTEEGTLDEMERIKRSGSSISGGMSPEKLRV